MSVIWGVIKTEGKTVSEKIQQSMQERLSIYKLDSINTWDKKNIYFGCGLQYITPESLHEILPYYNDNKGLVITADAIIDNREELFEMLKVPMALQEGITDSELILLSFEKWEKDCPKYLVGDFAFSIWDEKKQELFCARDHVGKRTFYYYYSGDTFAFSTVMKPLFEVMDKKVELNERWITDFLAIDAVIHETESRETIYNEIYQLPSAYSLTFNENGVNKENYWDPLKNLKQLHLNSDKEYDDAFKKVYFDAVQCRLRSIDEVGILLSGGLDSGSVACIAARSLANKGRKLKGFSSIPMEGFENNTPKSSIPDESEYIRAIEDYCGNIDVVYSRSEGKNSLTGIETFITTLEQPFKIIENFYWYDELTRLASESNCKVLLDGQYGNLTISAGDFSTHILTLYRKGRLLKFIKEIKAISNYEKVSLYRVGKHALRVILPYKLRKLISTRFNKGFDRFSKSPVNRELISKWSVEERLDEQGFNQAPIRYYDLYESSKFVVNPVLFSHMSAIETKVSLTHGIVKRDPTRDKRVIEFCLSLPPEQFVKNGQERHLIRSSMKGIMPDKVRLNTTERGLQSADWIQRIRPEWSSLRSKLKELLNDSNINKYINVDKIKNELFSMGETLNEKHGYIVRMLLITLNFSYFVKDYHEDTN